MSVIAAKRKESRDEAIAYSIELHDMLIELMRRSFGVKDVDQYVRVRFAYVKDPEEDFAKYRYIMTEAKNQIERTASLLTANLRAAKSLYPTSMHEYEIRRDYQNAGIVNCNQLIDQLQHVVDVFNVDLNVYGRYIKAIDREIGLIKKWRQRDNKMKSYLSG